ncbi:MAG: hypothetical protein GX895_13030 [Clostridiales bacterium]|uniref:hypothetical protein n=1 Tax=Clostridium sp. N3C TaxID=1776758 RepID=UPI00092E17FB|nr:hypothetical protein [Clostridium sp. N3C]NLZ49673.1 hypothetical protein [Clostridiales bacterium]SCN21646.1 hypothetical protein N3C_0344 [Clostridium sp. N3C]
MRRKKEFYVEKKEYIKIDMRNLKIKGDVIDIGVKNYGIIYKMCRESFDEVALDYIMEEEKRLIEKECYDTAILFFTLNLLHNSKKRKKLIKEVCNYISEDGEILLWDLKKSFGQLVDLEVEVLFNNGESEIVNIRNRNPVVKLEFSKVKKIIYPYFDIVEEKEGNNIFFIRARRKKKGKHKDETSIDSIKC